MYERHTVIKSHSQLYCHRFTSEGAYQAMQVLVLTDLSVRLSHSDIVSKRTP